MESNKTDTAYSWLVAFCAGVIVFIHFGLHRISGIFYAESISYFQTNREAASYPYTLVIVMKTFTGPMTGFLYHILGMRQVIILGSFLSCLGICLCFFATDILAVIIFWGILYGLGTNIATPLLFQALNLYFKKNVSKASGLALAGGSISGIILPSLCQFLLEKYGLPGSYLIISAFALHCIPAAMLIRNPVSINTDSGIPKSKDQLLDRRLNDEIKNDNSKQELFDTIGNDSNVFEKSQTKCFPSDAPFKDKIHLKTKLAKLNKREDANRQQNQGTSVLEEQEEYFIQKCQIPPISFEHQNKELYQKCSIRVRENFQSMENVEMRKSNRIINPLSKYKHLCKPFKVFYNPSYIFLAAVTGFQHYKFIVIVSIIVDYSNDKGISAEDSKYFLMGAGFLDLFSKLGLGWVTDGGYVTRKNYHTACSFFSAVTLAMVVWSQDFISLLVCISFEGMWFGASMTVMPTLLCSYVEREQRAMALASYPCVLFPLYISSSSIIGYFRDDLGSYDILVYILMALSLVQVVLILSLPVVDRWWKKKNNSAQNDMN